MTLGYLWSSRFRMSWTRSGAIGSYWVFAAGLADLDFNVLAGRPAGAFAALALAPGIDTKSKAVGLQSQEQGEKNGIHNKGGNEHDQRGIALGTADN